MRHTSISALVAVVLLTGCQENTGPTTEAGTPSIRAGAQHTVTATDLATLEVFGAPQTPSTRRVRLSAWPIWTSVLWVEMKAVLQPSMLPDR
jgi:hypothetical protein